MFVTLTDANHGMPVLVNLDRLLYAYRHTAAELTVLVFGKLVMPRAQKGAPAARVRPIAVTVLETLTEIQEKRRMVTG